MSNWQRIETVPRDGRVVELYRPMQGALGIQWASRVYAIWHVFDGEDGIWIWPDNPCVDVFDERRRQWVEDGEFYESLTEFTHWRDPGPSPSSTIGA